MIRRRTAPYAGRERRLNVALPTRANVAGLRLREGAIAFYLISSISGEDISAFAVATDRALVLDLARASTAVVALRAAGFAFDDLSVPSLDALGQVSDSQGAA